MQGRDEACARKQSAHSKTAEARQVRQDALPQTFHGIHVVIIG